MTRLFPSALTPVMCIVLGVGRQPRTGVLPRWYDDELEVFATFAVVYRESRP